MKGTSPFTPGRPVPPDLFVGREDYVRTIRGYLRDTASGRQENIFLAGDRGIGKSSLARYIRRLAAKDLNILPIHVFLGGVSDLDELVRRIFEEILKESSNQSWFSKVKENFGNYIESVDLFGISLQFNPPKEKIESLTLHFPEAIMKLLNDTKNENKGILIILDDINGLSKAPEFAHWYKSFVDYAATHYDSFPVCIMLIGVPELRDSLSEHQQSLLRIFHVINIERLKDPEVDSFFKKAFSTVNIQIDTQALELMRYYSSGLPIMMQEIGDATYRKDSDAHIDKEDAFRGILSAATVIGEKYLSPKVYRTIRSKPYRSILRKMGQKGIDTRFNRKEISEVLNAEEIRVFDNFLRKMKELGIIVNDIEEGRGHYKYINALYPVYISMESLAYQNKGERIK